VTTPNDVQQPLAEKSSAEDAWRVFVVINDWIKHADAKIAGTLAAAGASRASSTTSQAVSSTRR